MQLISDPARFESTTLLRCYILLLADSHQGCEFLCSVLFLPPCIKFMLTVFCKYLNTGVGRFYTFSIVYRDNPANLQTIAGCLVDRKLLPGWLSSCAASFLYNKVRMLTKIFFDILNRALLCFYLILCLSCINFVVHDNR
jgi:hypothetical protein